MLHQTEQVLRLYEDLGQPVALIAKALDLDLSAVKLCLLESSPQYKREAANERVELASVEMNGALHGTNVNTDRLKEKNVSDEEYLTLKRAAMDLALSAENEGVRGKMMVYLMNEHHGRNDLRKGDTKNTQINITMLNERIEKANRAIDVGSKQERLIEA